MVLQLTSNNETTVTFPEFGHWSRFFIPILQEISVILALDTTLFLFQEEHQSVKWSDNSFFPKSMNIVIFSLFKDCYKLL